MVIIAQEKPMFQPAMRVVTAISNSNPAIVVTSFAHNYFSGEIVRLNVPDTYGMTQIDKQYGLIKVLGNVTFSIDINSTAYDIFSVPVAPKQVATVVPIAEKAEMLKGAVKNVLPDYTR
jgi:hypothetical protein